MIQSFSASFSCNSKPWSGCSPLNGVNHNLKKETKSKPQWQKILKFQYRFKVHNTQLNRRQFTRNYYGLKIIEILKNLGLRFSLLKLAYYLSSRVIFLNLLKTTLPANKFTIQARGSKLQNMAWKQKNTAYNLFPKESKAIIYLVDVNAEIKT